MHSPARPETHSSSRPCLTYRRLGVFHVSHNFIYLFNYSSLIKINVKKSKYSFSLQKKQIIQFCTPEGAHNTLNYTNASFRGILLFWVNCVFEGGSGHCCCIYNLLNQRLCTGVGYSYFNSCNLITFNTAHLYTFCKPAYIASRCWLNHNHMLLLQIPTWVLQVVNKGSRIEEAHSPDCPADCHCVSPENTVCSWGQ